jgi:hypothetical protein
VLIAHVTATQFYFRRFVLLTHLTGRKFAPSFLEKVRSEDEIDGFSKFCRS